MSHKAGSVSQRGFVPTHTGAAWRKPPRGGGLVSSRWRLARTTIHSTWTLTDLQTGYRRHFPTASAAMAFVREQQGGPGVV
jgi:hypothetical protein